MRPRHVYHLGPMLRSHRLARRIRQSDLARQVGVGRQWIIALEKGSLGLDLDRTLRTIAALDLEIELHLKPPLPAWAAEALAEAELSDHKRNRPRHRARRPPKPGRSV